MAFLEQQLSALAGQLEQLRAAIPVDPATIAVTLEKHSPGNGSTYTPGCGHPKTRRSPMGSAP